MDPRVRNELLARTFTVAADGLYRLGPIVIAVRPSDDGGAVVAQIDRRRAPILEYTLTDNAASGISIECTLADHLSGATAGATTSAPDVGTAIDLIVAAFSRAHFGS